MTQSAITPLVRLKPLRLSRAQDGRLRAHTAKNGHKYTDAKRKLNVSLGLAAWRSPEFTDRMLSWVASVCNGWKADVRFARDCLPLRLRAATLWLAELVFQQVDIVSMSSVVAGCDCGPLDHQDRRRGNTTEL